MNPRCINKNDLGIIGRVDSLNLVTRGLWLVGHDGDLLAHHPVKQSRLTDVWPANDGNKTATIIWIVQIYFPLLMNIKFLHEFRNKNQTANHDRKKGRN